MHLKFLLCKLSNLFVCINCLLVKPVLVVKNLGGDGLTHNLILIYISSPSPCKILTKAHYIYNSAVRVLTHTKHSALNSHHTHPLLAALPTGKISYLL